MKVIKLKASKQQNGSAYDSVCANEVGIGRKLSRREVKMR